MKEEELSTNLPINYPGLVEAWIVYRKETFGESMGDIYHYIESQTGKKIDRGNLLKFRRLQRSSPDSLLSIINSELPQLIKWLMKRLRLDLNDNDIKRLCYHFTFPVKQYPSNTTDENIDHSIESFLKRNNHDC
jgi:hypothetical protein